jgi:hypothetical protein
MLRRRSGPGASVRDELKVKGRHDIAEILLKVALNKNQINQMKVGGGGVQAFKVDRKVCESQASRDDQKVGWGGSSFRKVGCQAQLITINF